MNTIPTSVAREYVGSGKTDAQIRDELAALTKLPIQIAELENFLDFEALARRNAITGAWQGPLVDVINAGGALGEGLEELFSHINKPRSVEVATDQVEWAVKAETLLSGLQLSGIITAEQHAGFHALGGGYLYENIVVQDVADAFAAMDEEDSQEVAMAAEVVRQDSILTLAAEIANSYINPAVSDGVSTEAQVRAAIKAGL